MERYATILAAVALALSGCTGNPFMPGQQREQILAELDQLRASNERLAGAVDGLSATNATLNRTVTDFAGNVVKIPNLVEQATQTLLDLSTEIQYRGRPACEPPRRCLLPPGGRNGEGE